MRKLLAFIALILSVAMLLSLTGCKKKKSGKDDDDHDGAKIFGDEEISCELVAGTWSADVDASDVMTDALNKMYASNLGDKYDGCFDDIVLVMPITVELKESGEYAVYMKDEDGKHFEKLKTSIKKCMKEFYEKYASNNGLDADEMSRKSGYDSLDDMLDTLINNNDNFKQIYNKRAEGTYTIEGETLFLTDNNDEDDNAILICDRDKGVLIMDITDEQKEKAEENEITSNMISDLYPIELKKAK